MSIVSDQLYNEIMDNPPFSSVTLWLHGGHVLEGDIHVPAMPRGMAYPFPLTTAGDRHIMVDPAAIVAWMRYLPEGEDR